MKLVLGTRASRHASVPTGDGRHTARLLSLLSLLVGLVLPAGSVAIAPRALAQRPPGRGAISPQDLAKWNAAQTSASTSSSSPAAMQGMDMSMHADSPASTAVDPADAVCPRFASGSSISAPPELRSQNGTLEVTLNFLTATDGQGLVRYCYVTPDGQESPTLRVNPGDTLLIHFHNQLPTVAVAMSTDTSMAGMKMSLAASDTAAPAPCSGAMSATATNLHFHGLNVAPVCGQDEVVHTLIGPGQSFDYTVQIPSNEPPGLYWYHPHPHGFSEGQVQGGATGIILVEGLQSVVPSLASLPERTFVLRDQVLPAATPTTGTPPAWDLSLNYVPVTYPGYTPAVIPTNPGQPELWRFANTGADVILNLQYRVNGVAQSVQVVAMDGYPIAAGSSGQTSVTQTSVLLPPGSRAEFVVTTPNVGDTAQIVTEYWGTGPDGDYDPARPIANIVSQVGAEATATPATALASLTHPQSITRSAAKVTRFADLSTATPVVQRNLYFSEVLLDPTNPLSPTTFFVTEEGHTPAAFSMDQAPDITVHSGTVEDWVVQNRAGEDHIFHIHQIHFQVLEVNGVAVNDPAIRDTVDLPFWSGTGPYPSVKIRMDFRDPNIIGTFMYHCHILEHEDGGMMGEIQVLPAGASATATVAASSTNLTPNGNVTLTAEVAPATAGTAAPSGTVQFQVNGQNLGRPVALVNGNASLTTTVNGNAGTNSLTALYEGDTTYTEALSTPVSITVAPLSLTALGATGAIGSAVIAPIAVSLAQDVTGPVSFTCTLPPTLTEAACFVNPASVTASGGIQLTINTTPSHPRSSALVAASSIHRRAVDFRATGGGVAFASLLFFCLPRGWRRRGGTLALLLVATLSVVLGCGGRSGSSTSGTDPGTPAGSYTVVVTGTATSGSTPYTTAVNVPVTVQ